jgi:acyl phosphate:glycerol-3-phosphate acyltransferase
MEQFINTYNAGVILIVALSYLLGSFPTAYLAARYRKIDIFSIGSGNMGATNVVRAMGVGWGAAVLLIDILKGVVAIAISWQILGENRAAATTISAIAVIIGHNWSLFASLLTGTIRGGKGAATAFGTLLMIAPLQVILGLALMAGLVVALTRYVSLAVLSAFALAIIWMIVLSLQQQLEPWVIIYSVTLTGLLIVRFRENIQRLLAGTERRLGERA